MRLKPILIPINKQSIEVGDLTLPKHPNIINKGELGIAVRSFKRNDAYSSYDIVLIDLDAMIVEGDLYYYFDWSDGISLLIGGVSNVPMSGHGRNFVNSRRPAKIIASTNKSHNLPRLSEQAIKLLIDYYNKHKCMPEWVAVEEYEGNALYEYGVKVRNVKYLKKNQQGEVDIAVPEVEEKFDRCNRCAYINNANASSPCLVCDSSNDGSMFEPKITCDKCINDCKKQSTDTGEYGSCVEVEEKLYTEEEIRKLCSDWFDHYYNITNRGMKIVNDSDEWRKWFKSKKK